MVLANGTVLIMGGGAVEDWEVGKTYKVNQLVKSDSKLYICMNEHTSSSAFATDLLAGNWAFIGGAGYSNVIMDTIYEGDVQVSDITGYDTYTLASSADNYDYAICTVKITQTSGTLVKATTVVPANSSQAISWSYGVGSGNKDIATYGWVSFTSDKTSIRFALRVRGSSIASASLERVDGIKINTMTLSEIAELSMPSDVYITIDNISDNREYTTAYSGYIQAFGICKANGYMMFIDVKEDKMLSMCSMVVPGWNYVTEKIFVPKGKTIKFRSDGTCNWLNALFFLLCRCIQRFRLNRLRRYYICYITIKRIKVNTPIMKN